MEASDLAPTMRKKPKPVSRGSGERPQAGRRSRDKAGEEAGEEAGERGKAGFKDFWEIIVVCKQLKCALNTSSQCGNLCRRFHMRLSLACHYK
ncbi:unnamed protein product [Moneuplotes crassus]|uniref:Uncharacterized protein n=1 Tax=Euplotes crassus TaxID=5936 RepID=A0AAD1Y9C4_EUPCR|nr:unnamed protein product [Moneuplotes crassus]